LNGKPIYKKKASNSHKHTLLSDAIKTVSLEAAIQHLKAQIIELPFLKTDNS
jgi:hypothetical protein